MALMIFHTLPVPLGKIKYQVSSLAAFHQHCGPGLMLTARTSDSCPSPSAPIAKDRMGDHQCSPSCSPAPPFLTWSPASAPSPPLWASPLCSHYADGPCSCSSKLELWPQHRKSLFTSVNTSSTACFNSFHQALASFC